MKLNFHGAAVFCHACVRQAVELWTKDWTDWVTAHLCDGNTYLLIISHMCLLHTRSWDSRRHPGAVWRVKQMVEPFVLGALGGTSVAAPCWRPTLSHPHENKGVDYSWPCLWTLLVKLPPHLHVSWKKPCLKKWKHYGAILVIFLFYYDYPQILQSSN